VAGEVAGFFIKLGSVFDPKGFKDAEKEVKTLSSSLTGMSSLFKTVASSFALYEVGAFLKSSVQEFLEAERSAAKLAAAMKNLGSYSKGAHEAQLDFASALQKTTVYSDENIQDAQTLLTTFGLYGKQLQSVTKNAVDLASGLGIDLRSATMLLGKAFVGETGALGRYGIVIDDTLKGAAKFEAVLKQVQERFGGAAEAEGKTLSGRLEILYNQFSDMKERIGEELVPVLQTWVGLLEKAGAAVLNLTGAKKAELSVDEAGLDTLTKRRDQLKREITSINSATGPKYSDTYREGKQRELEATARSIAETRKRIAGTKTETAADPIPPERQSVADIEARAKLEKEALQKVDAWYRSTDAMEQIKFYQTRYNTQVQWDQMDLAQKQTTMESVKALWAETQTSLTLSGSFAVQQFIAQGMQYVEAWQSMLGSVEGGMKKSVKGFIDFTGKEFLNIKSFLNNIWDSILQSFLDMVAQMIARWLMMKALMALGSGGFSLLGGFAEGGAVPATGPYKLHAGEYVLPADVVSAIKSGTPPGPVTSGVIGASTSGPVVVNQSVTITGGGDNVAMLMEQMRQATKDGVAEALNFAKESSRAAADRSDEA